MAVSGVRSSCETVLEAIGFLGLFARRLLASEQLRAGFKLGLQLGLARHTFRHIIDNRQRPDDAPLMCERRDTHALLHLLGLFAARDRRHREQITMQALRQ